MDYRITAEERARFKRCRRQWDFASPHRRDLEPTGLVEPALPVALKEALAVYYYPGTWDWQPEVTQPLVQKALERSLDDAGAADLLDRGAALLDCYDAWASAVDDFAPVKINVDARVIVPDPDDPEHGLLVHDGSPVLYECLVDLVAADAADEYWVVCHRIVDEWQDLETLLRDEEALAACWAFEHDYLGIEIAGTIHNELHIGVPLEFPPAGRKTKAGMMWRKVKQNEPSGGGRSTPQHQRVLVRTSRPDATDRIQQRTAGVLRRTHIRRSRHEIAAVGTLIAAEVADMASWPIVYPTFGTHCRVCEFDAPCRAMTDGTDPQSVLAGHFRHHPDVQAKRKLGQSTWLGRGGPLLSPPP
jgi:hypothetical protein